MSKKFTCFSYDVEESLIVADETPTCVNVVYIDERTSVRKFLNAANQIKIFFNEYNSHVVSWSRYTENK